MQEFTFTRPVVARSEVTIRANTRAEAERTMAALVEEGRIERNERAWSTSTSSINTGNGHVGYTHKVSISPK